MKIINSKIVNGKKMFLIEEPIKKLGGVIEDNQGQWKYPGQITKINSPNITMKGVNYPVLGISEQTGEQKLMFPENNYKFKSTKAVIEYPITAQAGTTVKINKDNVVKEYDRRSPEYKAMYDSGRLMSYDKSTDTYRATPLETFEVKTKAPQWLIDKRNIEKNFTKEKFVKKYLPKWSGSMGETADNLSENAQKDYDKKVNDKLANILLKSNQKKGNKEANNLDWYNSFSEKEREIIQQSSLANKFAPAQRAYDLDVSNSTKKYNTIDVLTDADKLSQSVQGTPERFRLFPNAENNIESYVNPGMFLGSMAKGLGNVPKDIKNENYGQAALSIAIPLGVGSLAGIGNPSTGQFVNNLTNPFAGTGDLVNNLGNKYLPNAYKLNPKAITHESFNNPNSFYRQIDTPTFNEGLESGLIKGKQSVNRTQGENIINLNKFFGDDAYYFKGKLYSPQRADYIYEVNKGEEFFRPRVNNKDYLKKGVPYTVENTNVRVSRTPIPIEEATVYKKDWLKGYKPIEIPKSNFKSEIDWSKWNKEIPNNTQLMKEYNAIEKATKANGSWMKNSDGSTFQGTPEQFVNNLVNPLAGTGNLVNKYPLNIYKTIKSRIFPKEANFTIPEQSFTRKIKDIYNNKTGLYDIYEYDLPKELYPSRPYEDVQHKMKNLRKDLNIGNIEHLLNKLFQKGETRLYRDATIVGDDGGLFDSNTRYWLNREYGNIPTVGSVVNDYSFAKNFGKKIKEGLSPLESEQLVKSYKQVELPKQIELPKPPKDFKSEIDWEAWVRRNKNWEVEDMKILRKNRKEYDLIEHQTKSKGTWMKNPDGSEFVGTPEQFIQQNSQNFKKAFPDYHGKILNHNTNTELNSFDESFFDKGTGDTGFYGKGTYTHPNKGYTKMYGKNNYELYLNSKNKGVLTKENINDAEYFKRSDDEILKYHLPEYENKLMNYELEPSRYYDNAKENWLNKLNEQVKAGKISRDKLDEFTSLHNTKNGEVVVPYDNKVKSAIGNNGMFDMTNPNIYKTLVGGLATGTLGKKAMEKKEFGGKILDIKIEKGKKYFLINE